MIWGNGRGLNPSAHKVGDFFYLLKICAIPLLEIVPDSRYHISKICQDNGSGIVSFKFPFLAIISRCENAVLSVHTQCYVLQAHTVHVCT